ncbi:hypothetical protein ACOI1C_21465, partial [Bacillus sp. DJP31]|uniref:hypothetical protein n=1 Tax=Bacillus sp. DJP31 TaxID=3409789 RepID=UPI003BB5346F
LRVNSHILERKTYGVIFWLSSKDDMERDIVKEVYNFKNTEGLNFGPIYLVDNKRANFLIKSIKYTIANYGDVNFFYHPSGYNENSPYEIRNYGDKLPVQLINSSILPIRVEKMDSGPKLLLFVNESFSDNSFRRIIGLTSRITKGWTKQVVILFPDYLELEHKNIVQQVKRQFDHEDFVVTVTVRSFNGNITTLGEE